MASCQCFFFVSSASCWRWWTWWAYWSR